VFENPFARGGGVVQVAFSLPAALARRNRRVVCVSPHHRGLVTAPRAGDVIRAGSCGVSFDGRRVEVTLLEHHHEGQQWILLSADGFFETRGGSDGKNPYEYPDPALLLRDSLFACAAVPQALRALGLTRDVVVHVQDWEMAACALTVKDALVTGALERAVVVLTSHNPYDRNVPATELARISGRRVRGDTVYQRMIPLTDAPFSTVSRTFAAELTSDPLQTAGFAPHLQSLLRAWTPVGVDNGLFLNEPPPFSVEAVAAATSGHPEAILAIKRTQRQELARVLAEYRPQGVVGDLDGLGVLPGARLPDPVPVFMMFGRMDPRQKGFDVLVRAIESMPRGEARFVLTPALVLEHDPFLDAMKDLAAERAGEIVIYPIRMRQGYRELMAGSSFTVWPSFYEPFGGVSESYARGTPVVARATGGLRQQVTDLEDDPATATGFVYREGVPWEEQGPGWRTILDRADPGGRFGLPLYEAMVDALTQALRRASWCFRHDPESYGRMLANTGARSATLSWDRAAEEFGMLYDAASR
jgi:starch synthase